MCAGSADTRAAAPVNTGQGRGNGRYNGNPQSNCQVSELNIKTRKILRTFFILLLSVDKRENNRKYTSLDILH